MNSYDVVAYTADADVYCEACAREAYGSLEPGTMDREGNELGAVFGDCAGDTPAHCGACGVFLELPLTPDGWHYVLEAVIEALASGHPESVALTEWAPFYGFPDTLEPDPWTDRFDLVRGAWWACADYHDGQSSRGYRHLCKLGRWYRPGPLEKQSSLKGDSLAAYVRVAVSLLKRN